MRATFLLTVVVAALITEPLPLAAQSSSGLKVGARVRLVLPGEKPVKGILTRIDADSIGFLTKSSSAEPVMISKSDLQSVHVGKRSMAKGIMQKGLIGTGLGVATGALLGAALYGGECDFLVCSRTGNAVFGSMLGGTIGSVSGLFVGAIMGSERWTRIDVPR